MGGKEGREGNEGPFHEIELVGGTKPMGGTLQKIEISIT